MLVNSRMPKGPIWFLSSQCVTQTHQSKRIPCKNANGPTNNKTRSTQRSANSLVFEPWVVGISSRLQLEILFCKWIHSRKSMRLSAVSDSGFRGQRLDGMKNNGNQRSSGNTITLPSITQMADRNNISMSRSQSQQYNSARDARSIKPTQMHQNSRPDVGGNFQHNGRRVVGNEQREFASHYRAIRPHNLPRQPNQCHLCLYTGPSQASMRLHIERYHAHIVQPTQTHSNLIVTHDCPLCSFTNLDRNYTKQHMIPRHPEIMKQFEKSH